MGHYGLEKSLENLHRSEEWKQKPFLNARAYLRRFIDTCPVCQKMSVIRPLINALPFTTSSYAPMERISMDLIGPFPPARNGEVYILVIIDCFSRFVELYATRTKEAAECADCLLDFIGRYGTPRQVVSDNGREFVNNIIAAMSIAAAFDFSAILPYSKEENGIVERANREVQRHLVAIVSHRKVYDIWRRVLPLVQRLMNSSVHSSTGTTPAKILYGGSTRLEAGLFAERHVQAHLKGPKADAAKTLGKYLDELLTLQRRVIDAAAEALKARDTLHLRAHTPDNVTVYPIGTYVLVAYPRSDRGRKPITKLHTLWRGPLKVEDIQYNEYTLLNLVTGKREVHHITSLKQYEFDTSRTSEDDLVEVARMDVGEFVVEAILNWNGDPSDRESLDFLVKWKGLSDEFNLWLPWSELKDNTILHDYLGTVEELKTLKPPKRKHTNGANPALYSSPDSVMVTRSAAKRLRFAQA